MLTIEELQYKVALLDAELSDPDMSQLNGEVE